MKREPLTPDDLMRFLDGEVTPEERASIEIRLETSTELQRELAIFHAIKEDFHELSFTPPGRDSVWDRIRRQITRPVGWVLTGAGAAAWAGYGAWVFFTSQTAIGGKLAAGAVVVGILVLLADVIYDRVQEYGSDPYRGVYR